MTLNQQFTKYGINPNSQAVSGTNFVIGQRPTTSVDIPAAGGGPDRDLQREILGPVFTTGDLQAYVIGLDDAEKEALQEALWVEGFYGVVDTMDELADLDNFVNALGNASKQASLEFEWGEAEGMEGVPTLEDRFAGELSLADIEAAKEKYLKSERVDTYGVTPRSAVDRSVEASWASVLGRKPTDAEKRAAFDAVRAAEVEFATAEQSGMFEKFDRLGVIERQAEIADPRQKAAISMSKSSNLVRAALGLG